LPFFLPFSLTSYILFADRFLGDQRASYNQDLSFTLKISDNGPAPTARDVILEGGNGQQIIQPIFGQRNSLPSTNVKHQQAYIILMHV
jgi:laminin gamma 1